jgi:hypothetical protein
VRKLIACGFLAFFLFLCATAALAQTVQGVITGTVFDPTRAVVPNATVTITNEGTNISETRTTGADGLYRFSLVPPGTYSVTATASGFERNITRGVKVEASKTVPLDVTLEVGKSSVTVEVSTQGAMVQTATSDLASTVQRSTIENIPLLSRNVYDLTFLAPAVSQGMDFRAAAGGTRESATQYMLNGSDNNFNFSEGYNNITPPLESVSEFTMLTNNMSAQFGRAAGAVVSTSQKSGGNKFHGALYEFNRNKSLNASDFFSNRVAAPKPAYVRNDYGGEIDGPIRRDKTFFSFALDRVTLDTATNIDPTVPTAAEWASMQTAAGSGSLAAQYMSKYPQFIATASCPNEPASGIGYVGCISLVDPITDPQHSYFGRVDHNFSAKDRVSVTANIYRETYDDFYGNYNYYGYTPSTTPLPALDYEHYHNLALVETHTFGANVFNEFTVGQNRHLTDVAVAGGKYTDPALLIDGTAYGGFGFDFGPYEGNKEYFTEDRWQFQDNLGWIHGRHSVKVGGGWQWETLYRNWDLGAPGYYEFANVLPADPSTYVPVGNTLGSGVAVPSGYGTPTCPELSAVVTGTVVTGWNCYNVNAGQPVSLYNNDGSIGNPNNTVNYPDSNLTGAFPYYQELSINPLTGARANAYRHYNMDDNNVFIQDDWKVRPTFTLNLGLRWERYGAPTEENHILAQFTNFNCLSPANTLPYAQCIANVRTGPASSMWHTRNLDLGPRIGFAWDVFGNGRTALRGGYGISYDRLFDNIWSNGAWNPPYYALLDSDATGGDSIFYSNPPVTSPSYDTSNPIPRPGYRVSVRTMENNLKDSSAQNFFLGVEHQFAQNFLLRVNWQGTVGRHLSQLMNFNRYDGLALNPDLSWARPNALYSGFNYRANNVNSNYNAMVVELQKRVSRGLQFQGSYTWSHLLDYGSDLFSGSTSQGGYSQPFYFVSNAQPQLEYGNGAFDHRHSVKLAFSYELPVMRDQRGFAGKVVGGWQLTAFWQAYSGHPIEVYSSRTRYAATDVNGNYVLDANGNAVNIGGDYNLDGVNNDRPVYTGGSFSSAYSHASPGDGIFKDNNLIGCGQAGIPAAVANILPGTLNSCDDNFGVTTPNTLFTNPPGTGVRYSYLDRNAFYGPWFSNVDFGLFKNFKVTEGTKLQLRVEAFNFTNHPNFDFITSDLNSGNFGKSQGLAGAAISRRLQIGARFLF